MIQLQVNGEQRSVGDDVDPGTPLLWVLRDHLGLVGAKYGCGIGSCGACTVHVDGKAVRSCTMPVSQVKGQVTTIEGLAKNGKLHPLQQKFLELNGSQCGICTPGMLIAARALLERNPDPTETEIRYWLAGNLCRCTGYDKIIRSVQAAAKEMRGA